MKRGRKQRSPTKLKWTMFVPNLKDISEEDAFPICHILDSPVANPNFVALRNTILSECVCSPTFRKTGRGTMVILPWNQVKANAYIVMTTCLRQGHGIEANTWHKVIIRPDELLDSHNGGMLTPANLEDIYIQKMRKITSGMKLDILLTLTGSDPLFRYLSLWRTRKAKTFIRNIHKKLSTKKSIRYKEMRLRLSTDPIFMEIEDNSEPDTCHRSHEAPAKATDPVVVEEKEEIDDCDVRQKSCLICEERIPNTIVLPCQHMVICSECHIEYAKRNTPATKRCLQCQRIFEEIVPFQI